MTIEEYIVEQIKEKEKLISELQECILRQQEMLRENKELLSVIASEIRHEETEKNAYYEFTIWKSDSHSIYEKIEKLVKQYETETK